jgi:hypothetical protein
MQVRVPGDGGDPVVIDVVAMDSADVARKLKARLEALHVL